MPRPLRLLLTSVGGLGVPKLIETLRRQTDFDFEIVGVDSRADAVGAHFVDAFVQVPPGDAPEYADALLRLCEECAIAVAIPQSDPEALALSAAEERFVAIDCKLLASSYASTQLAIDKYRCLSHLRDAGVAVPQFFLPRNEAELTAALAALGFPEHRVVLKPVVASGSRGFRLLTSDFDELEHVLGSKAELLLSEQRLRRMVQEIEAAGRKLPRFLLMEYLEGASFSVDILVRAGRPAYVVTQRRWSALGGLASCASVESDAAITRSVEKIMEALPLRHLFNVDFAYSLAPCDGTPLCLDVNPRASASLAATAATGSFLLLEAIRDVLGMDSEPKVAPEPLPEPLSKASPNTKIVRYWNESYF